MTYKYTITPIWLNPPSTLVLNTITVDVEDWYQSTCDLKQEISKRVVRNTDRLLELFSEFDVKATFFVLGLVCEKYPRLVAKIGEYGHELATHGYSHELIYNLSPRSFAEDVRRSIDLIQNAAGKEVYGYRAPDFSINLSTLWALEVLSEIGIKYDSSIFPVYNPRYGIPRWPRFPHRIKLDSEREIIEFPISTLRVLGVNLPFVGGGYSRLLPFRLIRFGIERINRSGKPVLIYLHPYEVDTMEITELREQLSIAPLVAQAFNPQRKHKSLVEGFIRGKWIQGFNRQTVEGKLRSLLKEFRFSTVKDILNLD